MVLIDYLYAHYDWESRLSKAPYFLTIKHDGPYILFKYSSNTSDMSLRLVQEACGIIVREDHGVFTLIDYAMDKFFNYDEQYAAEIDWPTAFVNAKIDGSLMRVAYDPIDRRWLLSTHDIINAFKATVDDSDMTFGDLFVKILGGQENAEYFLNALDTHFCYYFEITSPHTRIACCYPETIYYLGRRNMETLQEDFSIPYFPTFLHIWAPRAFPLTSLEQCFTATLALGEDAEGFVVRDETGHRIKVKNPWYIAMRRLRNRLRNNSNINSRFVIELWKSEQIDNYLSEFPEDRESIQIILDRIQVLLNMCEQAYEATKSCISRKEHALALAGYPPIARAYVFSQLDEQCCNAVEYIRKYVRINTLFNYFKGE